MSMRSTHSTVTFSHAFFLPGYTDELPPGDYELIVHEELLQGLSFEAYRRTGTYLAVHGSGPMAGRVELRPTSPADLDVALGRGRRPATHDSETALSPSEDLT